MKTLSATCSLGSGTLHFLRNGTGTGTVLFLHGISFTARIWEKAGILSELGSAGYHALAVDLPGYGDSTPLKVPDAELLLPVVETLNINRTVIIAPSFSGRFAVPFILDNPSRVEGFVSVASRGIDLHQNRLHEMACPVLAVWGEKDDIIPLALADILVNAVPRGRKIIIPGGTHAPYLSDTGRFTRELLDFLKTCFNTPRPL
ncbi:MAG: alpha/beta hydrolase [Pseudomonadota bacterium]